MMLHQQQQQQQSLRQLLINPQQQRSSGMAAQQMMREYLILFIVLSCLMDLSFCGGVGVFNGVFVLPFFYFIFSCFCFFMIPKEIRIFFNIAIF